MTPRPYLLDLDLPGLTRLMAELGEPAYRARQVWHGLYQQLWPAAQDFTTLPQALREQLEASADFSHLTRKTEVDSRDGHTHKTLFHLPDGSALEAVLMRYVRRQTLCISTQSGCAMGCVFCATGQMGFRTNLTGGEIVEQVVYYARRLALEGLRPTNIVLMGMGEPFHNYEATMTAIDRLNDPQGLNLGRRRFTISTVGLVPQILRFAREEKQVNLAISLHAVDDELRSSMLPINRKYPVAQVLAASREYVALTGRRISFEWALIEGVNDTQEQAQALAEQLKGLLCHVNLIPLNPTREYDGRAAGGARARAFQQSLLDRDISCTVRIRRGIDINAGCGQLASAESAAPGG
jgi:23S rRNA (adenine2503-C2)-methyltransferase